MGSMRLQLRKATIDDLETLRYWDTKPHVISSDPEDDWNWEVELLRDPSWRDQLLAELDGHPIGFLQIIDPALEESRYWGKVDPNQRAIDIWIGEESDLGKGYGTQMMYLAIEKCFADPVVIKILIDPLASNTKAHRFYERLGFEYVEHRWFEDDYCIVFQLSRERWNYHKKLDIG